MRSQGREKKNPKKSSLITSGPDSDSCPNQAGLPNLPSQRLCQGGNQEIQGAVVTAYKPRDCPRILGCTGDSVYLSLKPIALDLLAMPASQAFAERVFSITGDLSRGRRNRARVILEISAFLKLNRGLIIG